MKRFATVCSGIGAPEVAWQRIGWRPVFASEIEAFPNAVREHHFPDVPNLGDMTKFMEWPARCGCENNKNSENQTFCGVCGGIRIDVLCGGTPCQPFSVAGLRAGLADPRGNLALTFLGIVERYAPRWVLWENVPGVHSSWSDEATCAAGAEAEEIIEAARRACGAAGLDLGAEFGPGEFEEADQANDFECFISGLEQLGYGVATRIFDAQYFGVAQRRRRVFVVGHIGGQWQRATAVLFDAESMRGNSAPSREKREGTAPTISARTKGGGGLGTDFDCDGGLIESAEAEVCATITKNYATHCGRTAGNNGGIAEVQLMAVRTAIGIDGGEIGCALRAEPSHSGDKGDGGVNTTLVAELSPTIRSNPRNNSNPLTNGDMLVQEVCSAVTSKWAKSSGGPSGGPSGDEAQNLVPEFGAEPIAYTLHGSNKTVSTASETEIAGSVRTKPPGSIENSSSTAVLQSMAVRRLTPRECERLQGFPDDYTLVKYRGKPACDGPRYKAIGNSMAVPNIEWIGRRIDLVDEILPYALLN